MLLCQKVQRVEGLGLCLGDGRNILGSWLGLESSEVPSCILNQNTLRSSRSGRLVIEERAESVWLLWVIESVIVGINSSFILLLSRRTHRLANLEIMCG